MSNFKKNQAGFTIFELLVSVAIIGMISALFVVNVSKETRGNELNEAVTMLNDQIRELQNLALSSKQSHARGLYAKTDDPGNTVFIIFNDNDDDTVYDIGEEISGFDPVNLPTGVFFGNNNTDSNFSGWNYSDSTIKNDSYLNNLLVFFYSPDPIVEIYIRQQMDNPTHIHSYQVSFSEFELSNGVDSVKVRINDYGLFEVIDN